MLTSEMRKGAVYSCTLRFRRFVFGETVSMFASIQGGVSGARCVCRVHARCHEYSPSPGIYQDLRGAGGDWTLFLVAAGGGFRGFWILPLPGGFGGLGDRGDLCR